jgi:hypothetical protein
MLSLYLKIRQFGVYSEKGGGKFSVQMCWSKKGAQVSLRDLQTASD